MEYRFLTEEDAHAFWQLRLRALREEPGAFSSSYEEYAQWPFEKVVERLRTSSLAGDSFIVGAFDEEELVGMIGFMREDGLKTRHKGWIWGVYVAPEARGRGVGRRLLKKTIDRVRTIPGVEQIYLGVALDNEAARQLYLSEGFETYGLERRALKLGGRYVDEENMVLWLNGP